MSSLIYTPSGLVVDTINPFTDGNIIDCVDWLIDKMTFSLGSLSDASSIQKAQTINQLAVDCVDNGLVDIDSYFDAVAEYAEVDPYVFLSVE